MSIRKRIYCDVSNILENTDKDNNAYEYNMDKMLCKNIHVIGNVIVYTTEENSQLDANYSRVYKRLEIFSFNKKEPLAKVESIHIINGETRNPSRWIAIFIVKSSCIDTYPELKNKLLSTKIIKTINSVSITFSHKDYECIEKCIQSIFSL